MKFQIIHNLDPAKLLQRIPLSYRDLISIKHIKETVDLLVFPYECKSVIDSREVARVAEKFSGSQNKKVGIGGCFTIEALDLLKKLNVEVFALSDFPLTDKSHQALVSSRALSSVGKFGYRFM